MNWLALARSSRGQRINQIQPIVSMTWGSRISGQTRSQLQRASRVAGLLHGLLHERDQLETALGLILMMNRSTKARCEVTRFLNRIKFLFVQKGCTRLLLVAHAAKSDEGENRPAIRQ